MNKIAFLLFSLLTWFNPIFAVISVLLACYIMLETVLDKRNLEKKQLELFQKYESYLEELKQHVEISKKCANDYANIQDKLDNLGTRISMKK